MENKMDGVKISVNNDGELKKPSARRGRPKKVAQKDPVKSSLIEARASSQTSQKSETKSKSKSGNGFMSLLISVTITAVIVGGVIYAWQKKGGEKSVNDVRQDARNVRLELEQRIDQLKNKLSGVEGENEKLKTTAKELEERVALLNNAKKDFSDPELGISFEYPALFGEVKLEMLNGASGKKVVGTFTKNDKLVFGGVDVDYKQTASGTVVDFLESQGYIKKKDKYYFLPLGQSDSTEHEIKPSKEIVKGDGAVLVLDKKSFISMASTTKIDIGENYGAILNLKSGKFKGLTFVNQDLGILPLESFEKMLKSVEVK